MTNGLLNEERIRGSNWAAAAAAALTVLASVAALLSLRALADDPQRPWWGVGGLIAVSAQFAMLAIWTRRRPFVYVAGALLNVAGSAWWIQSGYRLTLPTSLGNPLEFAHINILILAASCWVSMLIDRYVCREDASRRWMGYHRFATVIALSALLLVVAVGLLADAYGGRIRVWNAFSWLSLCAVAAAVLACFWDPQTRFAVATMYLTGLAAAGVMLDQLDVQGLRFSWSLNLVLAAYTVATSYLWSRRGGLMQIGRRLGIPLDDAAPSRGLTWLVGANVSLAIIVTAQAFWGQLTFGAFAFRIAMAKAALLQSLSLGMLARGRRRTQIRYGALALGVIGAIAVGWSAVNPEMSSPWLHRIVATTVALVATGVLYGLGMVKLLRRENAWTDSARRIAPAIILAAVIAELGVIGIEAAQYSHAGIVSITWTALLVIAGSLAASAVAAIAAALLPGADPLRLAEQQRSLYVYAAEGFLALLVLHLRLTMPWLFAGVFVKYWPLVVTLVAYLGVGLAEVFRRQRRHVLSNPLERTGVLLPILPVIGFWILPATRVNYSMLLLSIGVMYGVLSMLRRSFLFAILATLAANGALWHLLHQFDGLSIVEHPQFWLIPPAVCVLIASYWNAEMLGRERMTAIRYMAATVIYVASTADVFIQGVGEAPWLPVVLAALSLAGIFLGIFLQVRAFVYLGTSFLIVSLLTVIWYAAVDLEKTWVWWLSGIVCGILIIAVFALFEKKRDQVLRAVEQFNQWQP